MRLASLAAVAFLSVVAVAQSNPPQLGKVEGVVLEKETHQLLVGANVTWSRHRHDFDGDSDDHAVLGATDALGRFAFAVPVLSGENERKVYLRVRANAHHPKEITAIVHRGGDTSLKISVAREPEEKIGVLKGKVTNAFTGQGVNGAVVSIINGGGILTAITNDAGQYRIPGVGFHSNLQLSMVTPVEGDLSVLNPCLAPVERTFTMDDEVVIENISSTPPITYEPNCPTTPQAHSPSTGRNPGNPAPTLGTDSSLFWQQADQASIELDSNNNVWNSGHMNDFIKLETGGFIVGSDSGGVWLLTPLQQAIPLSTTWNSVNISSMAVGISAANDFYAATYNPGAHAANQPAELWETDTSALLPLLNWHAVKDPPPCGSVNKVLIVSAENAVVLACDDGVFWSRIPPAPAASGKYTWIPATFPAGVHPVTMNFSGLALGGSPAGTNFATITASTHGGNLPHRLIYTGSWVGSVLTLSGASVAGLAIEQFGRSTVASCPSNPNIQYAIASDGNDDLLAAVWKSTDGGHVWDPLTRPTDAGNMGWYNQVIAVSPVTCDTWAFGFRTRAPEFSTDGGATFHTIDDGGAGHEHSDLHALHFDLSDVNTLLVGSDGGLLAIHNINSSPTFESDFNREILDLQLYHAPASSQFNELVAASLQDNGSDDTIVPPTGPGQWHQQDDSDGAFSTFISPPALPSGNDLLLRSENVQNWVAVQWNGSSFGSANVIPVMDSMNPRDPAGIPRGPITRIHSPLFSNADGETMFAAAGNGQNVFGLFSKDDGSDIHWETIGVLPGKQNVSALSSFDGIAMFVGSDQGNIFRLDQPYTGAATQLTVNNPISGTPIVTSLVEFSPSIGFATLDNGFVLGWLGSSWNELGGGALPHDQPFNSVILPDFSNLIAISPTSVYISHDFGTTWATANNGLPTIPQGIDLNFVVQSNGDRFIYMATYGRSLWRTVFRE